MCRYLGSNPLVGRVLVDTNDARVVAGLPRPAVDHEVFAVELPPKTLLVHVKEI